MKYDIFFTSYTINVYVDLVASFFQQYIKNIICTYSTKKIINEITIYYNIQNNIKILSLEEYYEEYFDSTSLFLLQNINTNLGKLNNNFSVGQNKNNILYNTYNMYTYSHLSRDVKFEFYMGYDLHSVPYKFNPKNNLVLFNFFKYLRSGNL